MVAAEMRATPRSDCRPSITERITSGAASIAWSMARSNRSIRSCAWSTSAM